MTETREGNALRAASGSSTSPQLTEKTLLEFITSSPIILTPYIPKSRQDTAEQAWNGAPTVWLSRSTSSDAPTARASRQEQSQSERREDGKEPTVLVPATPPIPLTRQDEMEHRWRREFYETEALHHKSRIGPCKGGSWYSKHATLRYEGSPSWQTLVVDEQPLEDEEDEEDEERIPCTYVAETTDNREDTTDLEDDGQSLDLPSFATQYWEETPTRVIDSDMDYWDFTSDWEFQKSTPPQDRPGWFHGDRFAPDSPEQQTAKAQRQHITDSQVRGEEVREALRQTFGESHCQGPHGLTLTQVFEAESSAPQSTLEDTRSPWEIPDPGKSLYVHSMWRNVDVE